METLYQTEQAVGIASDTLIDSAREKREAFLRATTGTDYDHIVESGVLDLFHINPDTGDDSLIHTLIGDRNGGFHSDAAIQLSQSDTEATQMTEDTYIERSHLEDANSRERKKFTERPFEPHAAKVVINGLAKKIVSEKDGVKKVSSVRNSMYPPEYDVVTTLKAIEQAYRSRDPYKDFATQTPSGNIIANDTGKAIMLDGKTAMPIKLLLDPATEKILSAIPHVERRGHMNLDNTDIKYHLLDEYTTKKESSP